MRPRFALLFVALCLVFFLPSLSAYFVADDYGFLPAISFGEAANYFTKSWGYGNEYRPFLVFTYALDSLLFGASPIGRHAVNTILHGLNGVLLAAILEYLGLSAFGAASAAVLFVLNPVAHESVLWMSGRPVVLSTTFVLLALRANLRRQSTLASACFVAGLLTYEGAVVFPLLALLTERFIWRRSYAVYAGIAAAYLLAWNVFFHFRIERFPVELSPVAMARSFWTGLAHSLHGSSRLLPALAYLGILIYAATRKRLPHFAFALLWFSIAFAPFLLVHGYADRFTYLASAGTAALLASSLESFRAKWRYAAIPLAIFFAVGMQNRIGMWHNAGEIARRIRSEIRQLHPSLPANSTVVLLNVPATYRDAYVFPTGSERAVQELYGNTPLLILRKVWPAAPQPVFIFDCGGNHVH